MSAERAVAAGTGTILVVDDERAIRKLVSECLARCGHRVLVAVDGLDALRKFRAHPDEIDMVVLDVDMPHMDGAECLRQIRRLKPAVFVLLATGSTPGDGGLSVHLDKRTQLLRKPFALDDLSAAVSGLLRPSAVA